MKYLAIVAILALAACETSKTTGEEVNGFNVICLDGIEYWFNSAGGYGKSAAARIDPATMTYRKCK